MKNSFTLDKSSLSLLSFILFIILIISPGDIYSQVIRLTDTVIAPHEKIKFTWDSFPGNTSDYIALSTKEQAPGSYIVYVSLNGQKKGAAEFDGVVYGNYELRGYFNNETNPVRTKIGFRVGNKVQIPKILPDKPVFNATEKISITFSGFPGNESDWISIAQPGSAASSYAEYFYLHKKQSGTLLFDAKPFGVYELRGYFNNEYTIQTATQLIVGDQNLSITPDKLVFKSGEPITLKFAGFPGNQNDWISISKSGSDLGVYVSFQYLNKQKSGALTFSAVPDGDYELRGYVNNESSTIRVRSTIKVGDGSGVVVNQTPGTINIQGLLTNASGVAVPNGTYLITFRLYDALQPDSIRWEEKISNINVVSGIFSTILGKTKSFNINFDKPYFLGIQVGSDQELKPRIELTSTPYSLMAKNVENNSISSDKIQNNAITIDKIAPAIVSSINGIANDGGNIKIIAGANVSVVNNDVDKSITISAVNPGGGTAGISRINPGNAITVTGQDGPTATISVAPNSIGNNELQPNAINTDKIIPNVVSSINNVANDGGNVNIIAGANVSIASDNVNKTITISATGGISGTGSITSLTEGNGISIQNPSGPFPTIGLKPNILLGPGGSLGILNQNSSQVGSFSAAVNQGGFLSLSNIDLTNTFGVLGSNIDRQPLLYLNSRLGRQVIELKANEFSDGEMNLKNVNGNTSIRFTANNDGGGLVNVFNSNGLITTQLSNSVAENGLKAGSGRLILKSVDNNKVLELQTNTTGGGRLSLFNVEGTEALRLSTFDGEGGSMSVRNRTGLTVARIISQSDGDGELSIRNDQAKEVLYLSASDGNNGFLKVNDLNESELVKITAFNSGGGGFIGIRNRLGNQVVRSYANDFSDGEILLNSVLNNPTLLLKANDNAGGLINLFNKSGKIAARLTEQDGGKFSIFNTDETEMIQLSTLPDLTARIRVNNRLGNPVADLISNDFSDGQLTLSSVLKNPTVLAGANNDAGGLIAVLHKGGTPSAVMTEFSGFGTVGIFSPTQAPLAAMRGLPNTGFGAFTVYHKDDKTIMAEMTRDANENGALGIFNRNQFPIVRLGGNSTSDGQIGIFDMGGLITANLVKDSISLGGRLTVYNKNAKAAANLLAGFNGSGLLQLKNNLNNLAAGFLAEDTGGQLFIDNGSNSNSPRVKLSNTVDGGELLLYSKESNLMDRLGVRPNGEGVLQIANKMNYPNPAILMGGDSATSSGIFNLFNNQNKPVVVLATTGSNGAVDLRNKQGISSLFSKASETGGFLGITDGLSASNNRVIIDNLSTGGRMTLSNKDSKPVSYLQSGANGEGLWRIVSKADSSKNKIELGANDIGNGYFNLYNFKGSNTSVWGHNEFGDGQIQLKNNLGNLGASFTAFGTGGSVIVTDGKPGINQRALMSNTQFGGELDIFNAAGANTAIIGHQDDGRGKVEVGFSNGIKVARMTANTDGSGYIGVDNTDKNEVVRITANTGKGGGIGIKNAAVKDIITLTQNQNNGLILVNNANGVNTSAMGHQDDGRGKIEVGGISGIKVARMTANTDGSGFIGVDNVDKLEVVRITANNGKGGGIGLKNPAGSDIINLTQDNSFGAILVNNPVGITLATITHNVGNGGFIGTKDQNGKDAVWINTNVPGGGLINTFNDQGKVVTAIAMDGTSRGKISINGASGNEIARMGATSTGDGLVSIDNNAGKNIAGITSNSAVGGGYLYANNSSGKEVVQATSTSAGNGVVVVNNNASTILAGLNMHATTLGGYVFANQSNGKDVVRMSALTAGGGYVSTDNTASKTVNYLVLNTNNSGYIGIANAAGFDRARLTGTSTGAGYMSISNANGGDAAALTTSVGNNGIIQTYNSTGATITGLESNASGHGLIYASNSTGSLRALLASGTNGGEVALRDNNGTQRSYLNGSGYLELDDVDGAALGTWFSGSGVGFISTDKLQHPRAEFKPGHINVNGTNGGENAFIGAVPGSPQFGYIGVCNANIVGSPVKAGIYTNTSNQGVMFADIKNFRIDYPGKPDKEIWYGSVEGPELAAYVRGTGKLVNGKAIIEFPDHYQKLANTATMTVIVTPLSGKSKGLAVVKKSATGFDVEELMEGSGTYEFDWEAKCVRKGHEDFEVVRNKAEMEKLLSMPPNSSEVLQTRSSNEITVDPVVREKISRQQ